MNNKRNAGFTLIELLAVIVIIAILVALLFPTIAGTLKKAEISQARADVKVIENAIRLFNAEYGTLPGNCGGGGSDLTLSGGNSAVINALRGMDTSLNPRSIPYLQTPSRKGAIDGSGNFVDPWGTAYTIVLDCDYDNAVSGQSGIAYIFSAGPDRISTNAASRLDDVSSAQ